ncbi:uncharacterized protein LOC121738481 [Aricia agestis]|uniref:uncharacterized protein LOC121738481 n=1 Tax=Aricia agestis TaxID=91739 RepID=UPI001C202196|nr:uncharacterized protein LOC121738481 [Aricia agestis]
MKTCFLCLKSGKLTDFNSKSFKKCTFMSLLRKNKNYKYSDITFNGDIIKAHGYHLPCYKKFTVLKQKDKNEYENYCQMQKEAPSASSSVKSEELSDEGATNESLMEEEEIVPPAQSVLPKEKKLPCIFCGAIEKKSRNRRLLVSFPESEDAIDDIKKMARLNDDNRISEIIDNKEIVAYHKVCLASYKIKTRRQSAEQHSPGFWHENREWHQDAFDSLFAFIEQEIIEKRGVVYLADLLLRYKALLLELMPDSMSAEDVTNVNYYRIETLESKIMIAFGESLTIENSAEPHPKKIVYVRDITTPELASKAANLRTKKNKLEQAAYELRNCVTNINAKELADKLTAEDVIQEGYIPDQLFDFICNLIRGPDIRRKNSDENFVKIKSICSDIIKAMTMSS